MIVFRQTVSTFIVEERLIYSPSGEGSYRFARIRKRGISTLAVKKAISEATGVRLKHIRHAGRKDAAATATQWISWPDAMADRDPTSGNHFDVLALTRHTNSLDTGHVRANHFRLWLESDEKALPDGEKISALFPNFYGGQRFGREELGSEEVVRRLKAPTRERDTLSVLQAYLFNAFLSERLRHSGMATGNEELWTRSNGKRVFQAETDPDLAEQFAAGETMPTGPIFGYKVKLTEAECSFLASKGLDVANLRAWGKVGRGARRPLFVQPLVDVCMHEKAENPGLLLSFSLPSGAYATVFLLHLFGRGPWQEPLMTWPDFTQGVILHE